MNRPIAGLLRPQRRPLSFGAPASPSAAEAAASSEAIGLDLYLAKHRNNARTFRAARLVATLAPLVAFLLIAGQTYRQTIATAKQELAQTAILIADHSQRVLEGVDAILRSVAETVQLNDEFQARDLTLAVSYLDGLTRRLTQIEIIGVADARGDVFVASPFRGARNVRDREYFSFHAARADDRLFVGAPIKGRGDSAYTIPISRRVSGADGSFAGVVFAATSKEKFRQFFGDAAGGDADHAGLITRAVGEVEMFTASGERPKNESGLSWISPDLLVGDRGAVDYADSSGVRRMMHFVRIADGALTAVAERRLLAVTDPWLWSMFGYFVLLWSVGSCLFIAISVVERRTNMVMQAKRAIRKLSGQILQRQDQERRHIARELHDSTAQSLLGASLELKLASDQTAAEAVLGRLERARDLICVAQRELRTLAYVLHPPMLDEAGLPAALRHLAEGFADRASIRVSVEISAPYEGKRFCPDAEIALFRVAQEALTNAYRHSNARNVTVNLTSAGLSGDMLELRVSDDGVRGANDNRAPQSVKIGVGIAGMRERLHALGGDLRMQFGDEGTSVIATLNIRG